MGAYVRRLFTEEVYVENHARNGRSSKSFISEGHWDEVLKRLSPGDYVIIQFGHNDEKADRARHTEPGTTFDENLRRFVRDTRARGATPILLNAIVRRNFVSQMDSSFVRDVRKIPDNKESVVEGNILFDTHGAYLESPRNVAHEMKVPFVDANRITHDLISSMGPEKSKELYMWIEPNAIVSCPQGRQDNTHLSVYGARIIAKLLIDAIAREVPALGKYVRYYDFVVAKDGSGDFLLFKRL
ncbi:rhamnogalacturonan acetylesterase [Bacteroides sp. CR5/BHMF/2]|nr:rhamnogalacturonan acetylesterase [Bacteroides sp. CR5/BHMF/2]